MVRVDNEGLKRTDEALIAKVRYGANKKAKKCSDAIADSLPGNNIVAALNCEKENSGWA